MSNRLLHYVPEALRPWLMWAIASFFAFYQFYLQNVTTMLTDTWMNDYHINHLAVSNLSAAFYYSYVILQIPVGLLLDRYGAKRMLSIAAILLMTGCIGMAITHHYYLAFIARLLMGAGSAFAFVGMLYVSAIWFSNRQFALVVGLSEMVAMLGAGLGNIITSHLLPYTGWRVILFSGGVVAALLAVCVLLFIQDPPKNKAQASHKTSQPVYRLVVHTLAQPLIWYAGFFGFSLFAIINVFTSLWGVPFFQTTYQMDLQLATTMTTMILFGYAIGGPLNGYLSNRIFSQKSIMLVGSGLTTLLLACLFFIPNIGHAWLLILLLFVGLFSASCVQVYALVKEQTPKHIAATALATCNMFLMASGPLLQTTVGALLEHNIFGLSHNFQWTFRLSLGLLVLLTALSFIWTLCRKEPSTGNVESNNLESTQLQANSI